MKKQLTYLFILAGGVYLNAQEKIEGSIFSPSNPCGGYHKENVGHKQPIQYTHLREGDVSWEKRVWREIDLREKINMPLYYPIEANPCRSSLFRVLATNIMREKIIAFADEEFMVPLSLSEAKSKFSKTTTEYKYVYDESGNEKEEAVEVTDSTGIYERVIKYCVKEDWFFDKQKSQLDVRIIGLAAYEYVPDRDLYKELFWVYFPACRPYFAETYVYNTKNDAGPLSMDDVFWKRQFSSVIVKESNVQDRYISQYTSGIEAVVESDKIKMDLFVWEHDLWNY